MNNIIKFPRKDSDMRSKTPELEKLAAIVEDLRRDVQELKKENRSLRQTVNLLVKRAVFPHRRNRREDPT